MSIINDALKKAQRQKEYNITGYHGAYVAGSKNHSLPLGKVFLYSVLFLSIGVLTISSYRFINIRQMQREVNNPLNMKIPESAHGIDENATSIYEKAREFHLTGDFKEAKELYFKSLEQDPGFFDAMNNLGVIFIRERNFNEGTELLEKAIRLRPGQVDPYYNLACLLAIRGDIEKSLIYLGKALSLDSAVKDWAREDKDLDNLRGVKEFELMISNPNKK